MSKREGRHVLLDGFTHEIEAYFQRNSIIFCLIFHYYLLYRRFGSERICSQNSRIGRNSAECGYFELMCSRSLVHKGDDLTLLFLLFWQKNKACSVMERN